MVGQLDRWEQLEAEGRAVQAVEIYDGPTTDWLERDDPKHLIPKD